MSRHFATIIALAALVPLILLALPAFDRAEDARAQAAAARMASRADALSGVIESRISAAEQLVSTWVRMPGSLAAIEWPSSGGGLVRADHSGIFSRVFFAPDNNGQGFDPMLGRTAAERAAIAAGQPVTISAVAAGGQGSVLTLQQARLAGKPALLCFELNPAWLWQHVDQAHGVAVVVDAQGQTLFASQAVPQYLAALFAARAAGATRDSAPHSASWQAEGGAWHGQWRDLAANENTPRTRGWSIGVFESASVAAADFAPLLWIALLGLVALLGSVAVAASYLARRYSQPMADLAAGISRIGQRRFPALATAGPEEFAQIARVANEIGARVAEDVNALETLGEIDKLLLGSAELEPVLDAILERVHAVTRCHSTGIMLLDSDAPGRGRVFVAAQGNVALPVSRVELDSDMLSVLMESTDGVTVARCEDHRHSFLVPLRDVGAEYFWVWPVVHNGRMGGVLAIGFREIPSLDPRCASYAGQFAARLGVALSKTARDEHLYRQAHFDPLTSLPNRLLFRDRLAQELAGAAEASSRGALLYIDLDHFKKVNDSVGHNAGDQLLTIIAQRLRASVKEGDTVARLGGDEFTVILRNVIDPDGAAQVAERIVEALQMPVNIGGRDHFVAASIGVTLFPDDGATIDDLMRNADGAMYRAKDTGRGRAVFFDRQLSVSRLDATQSGLHRALRRREFSLFYQPQFSLLDGRLVAVEALLRWNTPRDGLREPREFIPAAEASGLIVDIGGWVLEAACAQLAQWRDAGIAPRRLSINVSAQQLKFAEFPRNIRRALDKYSIPPDMIEIELTESVFADEVASYGLAQIAALGVRIALDDFGTGFSSLNYLRQHPIQVVKIDRTFLEEVAINPASATIAETIITMAHALGKEVVGEGVETEEQLSFLREHGCDLAQGFYLARPLPVSDVTELLQARAVSAAIPQLRQAG